MTPLSLSMPICGPQVAAAMRIHLPAPSDFDFRRAVCSHGWFILAPNRWDPRHETLITTLAITDSRCVVARVRMARGRVEIAVPGVLGRTDADCVRNGVARMLRLKEDFASFHLLCRKNASHSEAADGRFGRLLRGASLFEDIVKVICTCNVTWRQTVSMVDRLVTHWGIPPAGGETPSGGRGKRGVPTSRKAADPDDGQVDPAPSCSSFPTADRLASASAGELRQVARLGYRADFVSRLARDVGSGKVDLQRFEAFEGPTPRLHRMLREIHGVGDYAASNLCMLLGRYDCLAIDTELVRFLRERHPRRRFTPGSIRRYYETWRPYQFLAYWWELWQGYERSHGPAHEWSGDSAGRSITAPVESARRRTTRQPAALLSSDRRRQTPSKVGGRSRKAE